MEKVRPWCGQPSDPGRLKNDTEQIRLGGLISVTIPNFVPIGQAISTQLHPRPTQHPILGGTGNEYRPKSYEALRLGSKDRHGSFHVRVAGKIVIPCLHVPYPNALEMSGS